MLFIFYSDFFSGLGPSPFVTPNFHQKGRLPVSIEYLYGCYRKVNPYKRRKNQFLQRAGRNLF